MSRSEQFSNWVVLHGAKLLFFVPFFLFVLVVNGSIPGVLTSNLGQAVWLTGFAQSLADAPKPSVFSYTIGLPEPAAIALGLPMALAAAVGLKAGLTPPDAYSLACVFWLAVAFWGAFALCRHFGASRVYSTWGATIWLTFPVVWQHAGYSAVSIGIALLPAYYYSCVKLLFDRKLYILDYTIFIIFCVTSLFMDGYSFVMFASSALASISFLFYDKGYTGENWVRSILVLIGFGLSYLLYTQYSASGEFRASMEFFRGWGVDISFLISPAKGILWLPDLIGQSVVRNPAQLFGDSSVYRTTFSLVPFVLSLIFLLSPYGDRKMKVFLFGIGLISLYLALGPSFKFNSFRPEGVPKGMPAEYALGPTGTAFLWKYVPGLNNMRAVYRWTALALLGFWCVMMLALADRRLARRWSYAAITLSMVYNLPHMTSLWQQYERERTAFLQLDADIAKLAPLFRPREIVAFLPAGNDFLINFLAPRLGIRSYNIGGDKNVAIAMSHWPEELVKATKTRGPEDFAIGILEVLNGTADAVAVPYMDLLMAAHQWPYGRDRYEAVKPQVERVKASGLFDVTETEYFALVRLRAEVKAIPEAERAALLSRKSCASGPATDDRSVRLVPSVPLLFSQKDTVCSEGWSGAEAWGRWTDGHQAKLHYTFPKPAAGNVLEFDARGYVGDLTEQRIGVRVNGKPAADWAFTKQSPRRMQKIEIPQDAMAVEIEFEIPNARSPKQVGAFEDARLLGLGVSAVCLTEVGKTCPPQ